MRLTVQHGKTSLEIEVNEGDRVEMVMEQIQTLTGTLKRNQKLICRGNVILPPQTLTAAKLQEGSKIMLLAGGSQTQGQAAAEQARAAERARKAERAAHGDQQLAERNARRAQQGAKATADPLEERSQIWKRTGIISLREADLASIPNLWTLAPDARVVDLAGNKLQHLPDEMAELKAMQKLRCSRNHLTAAGVSPGVFAALRGLSVLHLDNNRFEQFPIGICHLPCLRSLNMANNALVELPADISALCKLESLDVQRNKLASLPATIGICSSLLDLNLTANSIAALPEEMSSLKHLQRLCCDNNRLTAIPAAILTGCSCLHTLSIHSNPLSLDGLRQAEGYKEFDERRRAKYTKQMDMRTMAPTHGFDEGADSTAVDFKR